MWPLGFPQNSVYNIIFLFNFLFSLVFLNSCVRYNPQSTAIKGLNLSEHYYTTIARTTCIDRFLCKNTFFFSMKILNRLCFLQWWTMSIFGNLGPSNAPSLDTFRLRQHNETRNAYLKHTLKPSVPIAAEKHDRSLERPVPSNTQQLRILRTEESYFSSIQSPRNKF